MKWAIIFVMMKVILLLSAFCTASTLILRLGNGEGETVYKVRIDGENGYMTFLIDEDCDSCALDLANWIAAGNDDDYPVYMIGKVKIVTVVLNQ
jgi:hypothetical protein